MSEALVLLVEDNPDHADLIGGALEDAGHRVAYAAGGAEARARVEEAAPDLALLDYSLGGETGFDVQAWLQSEQPELPVVMLTGHGSEDLVAEAMQRGATDFLVKSLDRGFLRVLPLYVAKNLERARLGRALARAEAERAHQEAYRRLVVDSLDAVVVTVDDLFRVTDANRALGRLAERLGIDGELPVGRDCRELFDSGRLLDVLQELRTALALSEAEVLRREVAVDGADGRVELEVEATPLQAVDRGEGVVFVITDVTERNRARREEAELGERLARANDELARLAQARAALVEAVSKELRSPAMACGGYAGMLTSGALGKLSRKAAQAVDVIARGAERLGQLADDLDYLAHEAGPTPVALPPVPLEPLIALALESGTAQRRERRLRVRKEWPDPPPVLLGDATWLRRLFETLLADVTADCGERSSIQVRAERAGDTVVVSVEDDGSRSEAEVLGGSGPDLATEVAREVVRRHGGSLRRLPRGDGRRGGWAVELPGA